MKSIKWKYCGILTGGGRRRERVAHTLASSGDRNAQRWNHFGTQTHWATRLAICVIPARCKSMTRHRLFYQRRRSFHEIDLLWPFSRVRGMDVVTVFSGQRHGLSTVRRWKKFLRILRRSWRQWFNLGFTFLKVPMFGPLKSKAGPWDHWKVTVRVLRTIMNLYHNHGQ